MKIQAGKSLIEAPAVPDQQPVDIRIFLQQAVGWGADQPGDLIRSATVGRWHALGLVLQ